MSKRQNAKRRISRRLGVNLWGQDNDPFISKNYPPGMHGQVVGYRKSSDYGNQLRAKQQLRGYYGNITEKQFRRIFTEAARMRGDASENLIGLLESRLDAVVYRANFAPTVFAARQLVSHKHILVNGRAVNIASYCLKPGDIVTVAEKARTIPLIAESFQRMVRQAPAYITVDNSGFAATFVNRPKLADVPYQAVMHPNLVVEFYSR
jgi:small subunit ribosomal protein S4